LQIYFAINLSAYYAVAVIYPFFISEAIDLHNFLKNPALTEIRLFEKVTANQPDFC